MDKNTQIQHRTGEQLATSNNSLTAKLYSAHDRILAKADESDKETIDNKKLKLAVAYALKACGIKKENWPDELAIQLMVDKYNSKYYTQLNHSEIMLAFDLNVSGDLQNKIQHYQAFTLDYFCDVLNEYLKEKARARVKAQKAEEAKVPKIDMSEAIILEVIDNYKTFHTAKGELVYRANIPILYKMELLNKTFEVDISAENIQRLRKQSIAGILREVTMRKVKEQNFGARISLEHQVARLKEGKLITKEDENLIQFEVTELLYFQVFEKQKPANIALIDKSEFVIKLLSLIKQ